MYQSSGFSCLILWLKFADLPRHHAQQIKIEFIFVMVSAIDSAKRVLVALLKTLAAVYSVTLSLTRESTEVEVRSAFRRVSKKAHPDHGGKVEHQGLEWCFKKVPSPRGAMCIFFPTPVRKCRISVTKVPWILEPRRQHPLKFLWRFLQVHGHKQRCLVFRVFF